MTLQDQIQIYRRRIAMRKETGRQTFKLEAQLQALVLAQLIAETSPKPRVRVTAVMRKGKA